MIGQQTFLLDKWPRPKKIDPNSPDSLSLVKYGAPFVSHIEQEQEPRNQNENKVAKGV